MSKETTRTTGENQRKCQYIERKRLVKSVDKTGGGGGGGPGSRVMGDRKGWTQEFVEHTYLKQLTTNVFESD